MSGEDGINVILKVGDGGEPEVFTILAGQQSTTLNLASAMADTTNKDDAGWQGSPVLPGQPCDHGADRGVLQHLQQAQPCPERLLQSFAEAHQKPRISAELEEIVEHARLIDAE